MLGVWVWRCDKRDLKRFAAKFGHIKSYNKDREEKASELFNEAKLQDHLIFFHCIISNQFIHF